MEILSFFAVEWEGWIDALRLSEGKEMQADCKLVKVRKWAECSWGVAHRQLIFN